MSLRATPPSPERLPPPPAATSAKRSLDTTASKKGDRSKRIRVSRACDQCRASREKCDGCTPQCGTCEGLQRSCTYHEQPKKRGIQPNYIRTLELTLAWLLQQHPNAELRLSHLLPDPAEPAHRAIAFKDVPASDTLHQTWRNGIICRQIDQLLSGSEIDTPTVPLPLPAAPNNEPTAYHSPPLSAPSDGPDTLASADGASRKTIVSVPVHHFPTMAADTERLKLPERAWNLLEHYFAFTHSWLPVSEKHDLLRVMYTYHPDEGLRAASATASEHAELWSILAWSAAQQGDCNAGDSYQSIGRSLIPTERVEPGHIRALLILGLRQLAESSWTNAWLTIGSAVRLLTHSIAGKSFDNLGAGRIKHAFLAAFLLENAIASKTGALTHLRLEEVRCVGLLVEDGLEEWSPWSDPLANSASAASKSPARSISTFNELVRLALQFQETGMQGERESFLDVVFRLLKNASTDEEREQPSAILARAQKATTTIQTGTVGLHELPRPSNSMHARNASSNLDFWSSDAYEAQTSMIDQQYPFMSIPNEGAESLTGSTPNQTITGTTPGIWNAESNSTEALGFTGSSTVAGSGADIFEELAMLDRSETQNPKFMQNLGFGPDLDLAEFFGADYQPSNPLLSYVTTTSFPDFAQSYGTANDPG